MTSGAKKTAAGSRSVSSPGAKLSSKDVLLPSKRGARASAEFGVKRGAKRSARSSATGDAERRETDVAIATELAPAVAIALLGKTEQAKGAAAPALEPFAAGAVSSDTVGHLRVQLLFENGAILPIEMSEAAAEALGKGIAKELRKA